MNQKGFANIILIVIIVAVALGGYFVLVRKPTTPAVTKQPQPSLPNTQQQVIPSATNKTPTQNPPTQPPITELETVPNGVASNDSLGSKPYVSIKNGFLIRPPKGWGVDESGKLDTFVIFKNSQADQVGINKFNANIIVSTPTHTECSNVNEYFDKYGEKIYSMVLPNYKLLENKNISLNGKQAKIISGIYDVKYANGAVVKVRNMQLMIVINYNIYQVTGTVLDLSWNKYGDLLESSLLTFELK